LFSAGGAERGKSLALLSRPWRATSSASIRIRSADEAAGSTTTCSKPSWRPRFRAVAVDTSEARAIRRVGSPALWPEVAVGATAATTPRCRSRNAVAPKPGAAARGAMVHMAIESRERKRDRWWADGWIDGWIGEMGAVFITRAAPRPAGESVSDAVSRMPLLRSEPAGVLDRERMQRSSRAGSLQPKEPPWFGACHDDCTPCPQRYGNRLGIGESDR